MRYTTTMNQEMKRRVTACAAGFSLPRYRELPSVGLYLDQTVQLVNSCFRGFPGVELTPSMVSNYVKKGVISHPVKRSIPANSWLLSSISYCLKMSSRWKTSTPSFRCRGLTAPPPKPTTTSATR